MVWIPYLPPWFPSCVIMSKFLASLSLSVSVWNMGLMIAPPSEGPNYKLLVKYLVLSVTHKWIFWMEGIVDNLFYPTLLWKLTHRHCLRVLRYTQTHTHTRSRKMKLFMTSMGSFKIFESYSLRERYSLLLPQCVVKNYLFTVIGLQLQKKWEDTFCLLL